MKEKIIFQTNPHLSLLLFPEILGIFLMITLLKYLPSQILIIAEGILVVLLVIIFLEWTCTKYYLTDSRLTEQRGVIGKRIVTISLNKVQDIKCKFGIMGRILGFGDLEIESAGTSGKIVFHFIPSPRKFQEKIKRAISGPVF